MIAAGSRVAARLAVVLAVHLGVIAGLPEVAAGEERPLFMFVMNQSGQPLLDLRADEIQVRQSGGECTVVSIQPETEGMKIALLVDNTASAESSLNSLRDGLRGFLQTLPAGHEVGLFTIAGQTRRRVDFTPDRDALVEETDNLFVERGGGTVLLDGLVETWDRRFDEDDAWPVFVLVLFDGSEASSSVQGHEFNEFVLSSLDAARRCMPSSSRTGAEVFKPTCRSTSRTTPAASTRRWPPRRRSREPYRNWPRR